jgi:hypothetical protein
MFIPAQRLRAADWYRHSVSSTFVRPVLVAWGES